MNTIKIKDAEFAITGTIDTFVTIFQNPGKPVSMSISLSGSGAPFASTQKIPAGMNRNWFEPQKDKDGNIVPGRLVSKFPLMVAYNGLKRGTKNPDALFANITTVSERPMMSDSELAGWFETTETPATQTAEQANAAGSEENNPF